MKYSYLGEAPDRAAVVLLRSVGSDSADTRAVTTGTLLAGVHHILLDAPLVPA